MRVIERMVEFYVAFDGKEFTVEAECIAYEKSNTALRLVGLTLAQIEGAIDRSDPELADAIEAIGSKIARARREGGDLKRERKPKGIDGSDTLAGSPTPDPAMVAEAERRGTMFNEGFRAFHAGQGGVIPEGLSNAEGERWLSGWDAASLEAAQNTGRAA